MASLARLIGLFVCLLALLTTCSVPLLRGREARISEFVAESGAPQVGGQVVPTVQPSVTPIPQQAGNPQPSPTLAVPVEAPASLSAAMAPAQAAPVSLAPEARAARMEIYLQEVSASGGFSGAVLVAQGGKVLLSRGYGLANGETNTPNSPHTRFRLASVSKPITAIAVMQLVAAGQIDVNASICSYLSGCPLTWQPVTVRNLLNHSSGIVNYTDFANFADVEQLPASFEQLLARFRDLPLGFTPGSAYQYCNSNYVLLGRIIEEVSGKALPDYLHERIFAPLGMRDSGYDSGDAAALNGTRGYAAPGVPAIPINTSNLFAAGGFYSTAEDMHRLAQALDDGQLIPPAQAAQMYAPLYFGYGYGWKIEHRYDRRVIYHPGFMSGANTYFGRYPEDGLTVIVLSNLETANVLGIADYLAALAFS